MSPPPSCVLFTCTYYGSLEDVRLECCVDFLKTARSAGLRVIVVDDSPLEAVRDAMREAGAQVRKQREKGKKGVALREALQLAAETGAEWLCWQEAEKADMAIHWTKALATTTDDVACVVPSRDDAFFRETYPRDQYFSENFANGYVAAAAKQFASFDEPIDWHFGPFALRRSVKAYWLKHRGELWDAQVVPIVQLIRDGLAVRSVVVPFRAPLAMKAMEEGNFAFLEKRLMQINFLDPKVVAAFKNDSNLEAASSSSSLFSSSTFVGGAVLSVVLLVGSAFLVARRPCF